MTPPPGLIREVPGRRRVLRTILDGQACVTRVLLAPRIEPSLAPLVEKIVLHGHGSMLGIIPEELQLTLEGYRVAARLPTDVGPPLPWTRAVAAGVDADGHVTISTRWIEGTPLHEGPLPSSDDARAQALDALRILHLLHDRLVAYGDFKSENLVLRADGTVALIDLDTLREVAAPTAWTPTRDLTRAWAAPEQEHAQRTHLASDLWAWARLVDRLFDGRPPDAWRLALATCRASDPLRRPRTGALLRHLELGDPLLDWHDGPVTAAALVAPPPRWSLPAGGEGGAAPDAGAAAPAGATERVPEAPTPAGATERVPETGAAPPRHPSTPTAPRAPATPAIVRQKRPRRGGCLYAFFGLVLAPVALCAGLGIAWDRSNVAAADAAAADTLAALKANKTRPDLNRDPTQREALRRMAAEAAELRPTARSTAVHALAAVWAQGWQDAGRAWSPADFAEGMRLVEISLARAPEALLARATLEGAACRLDARAPTSPARCEHALADLTDLHAHLDDAPEHHWLRVEAAFTEVLVRSARYSEARTANLPEAADELAAAHALCARAEAWFPYAPVNGPELFEECLTFAGLADDPAAYTRWGSLLVGADLADGALSSGTLRHLYTRAGTGCDTASVEKRRGEWVVTGPSWCVALGHAARGCGELAANAALGRRVNAPDRPWPRLEEVLASRVNERCAR